ncbi:MAG: VWA domain-containing protein [Planctomycetes bacterium]|nr:VWA domain-containing protein [Planctomycetota bacterium]
MNVSRDYFCHLVLRLCESTAWREWNGVMREHLVNAQVVDGDESGSWFNPNGVHAEDGGRLYQTAFNIMLLEVYYRHLPIYRAQSDEDDFPVDAADDKPLPSHRQFGTESYDRIDENAFRRPWQDPLSTFSIDVDTASYANARRFLERGDLPPADSVRIEEFINYFSYDYAPPTDEAPFATHVEIAACPWNKQHRLARIGIKGREISRDRRPPANLVFLLDVSGSMTAANKLPYVKTAMKMLVQNLTADDRVAIVVYAGASGLVLSSTPCSNKRAILEAIERLKAGGMTNGGEGIQLAYRVATENFAPDGVNRVVLCTDGDFNVGVTSQGALTQLIEEKADSGVFLTVFGFGMDNYKDSLLEKLADRGNGNYGYIDTIQEAHKMLVEQLSGTLVTIAKDVKIQVEFNPARVSAYRLIGYENRTMAAKDFADDKKDAGEIGAGHTVTALYELVAAEKEDQRSRPVPLRFQRPARLTKAARGDEAFELKLRYKDPDSDTSRLLLFPVADSDRPWSDASPDLQFAAAVAGFGMLLHDSLHKGNTTFKMVVELANAGKGDDPHGYRSELVRLVNLAQALAGNPP